MRITDPLLRDRIAQAMGDIDSARILHSTRSVAKNAEAISSEVGVPLSSIYRKLAILRGAGLVFVKSFEITPEGKRQDMFLSAVKEVKISVSEQEITIELTPTDESAHRMWFKMFAGTPASKEPPASPGP